MSPEKRGALMGRIKGKDTGPELVLARALRERDLVFERHKKDLPGSPDVVFRPKQVAIFIDGSFWHGWRLPLWEHKLSQKWREKIIGNRQRDQQNFRRLRRMGWVVVRIWEHQVEQDLSRCVQRVLTALRHSDRND